MNTLAFDIETIPDIENGKKLYQLEANTAEEIVQKMQEIRRAETNGSDFMRHYLHRVIVISVVLDTGNTLKVWSLSDENATEKEIIQRFFEGIDKYSPTLVSWNGGGFDLPVLHYRALLHGVVAPRYWEIGEADQSFRFNHYLNRFHYRHTDLMDVLSGYQGRAAAPLDDLAIMCGFPGKIGLEGSQVWPTYQRGEITHIRQYCEVDALNTYLVYLKFEQMRGKLTPEMYSQKCQKLRALLENTPDSPHFEAFLQKWH